MSDDTIEILCRNREEFIGDYLLVVTEMDRQWCVEMAIAYETLADGDFYPVVFRPDEDLIYDE